MSDLTIQDRAKAIVAGKVAAAFSPQHQTEHHGRVMAMLYGELLLQCRDAGMSLNDFGALLDEIETEVDSITSQHERN